MPLHPLPVVALVGRPNVGKSSLFNRLVGARRAIVQPTPGVTRDRLYADAEWAGRGFTVVDTGGLGFPDEDPFGPLIAAQVEEAVAEADAVVLVTEATAGVTPGDADIAALLRRTGKPALLVVNKAESPRADATQFYALGFGEPLAVSALHGDGVGDLLDRVLEVLPTEPEPPAEPEGEIRVAVVGRPNVGKSTLVNALIGRQRLITSDIAGTTRDAVDVRWTWQGESFVWVDTPGLRRPARVQADLERSSVHRALRAIDRADVATLVLDATELATEQDKRIAGYAHDRGRAAVLVVNKWDLADSAQAEAEEYLRWSLPFLGYAPILFCSARSGWHLRPLPGLLQRVARCHRRALATAELNRVIRDAVAVHAPPQHRGRPLRIYYATQIASGPPTVLLFVNRVEAVRDEYLRFLENRLREAFQLEGTPLRLHCRPRPRDADRPPPRERPATRT